MKQTITSVEFKHGISRYVAAVRSNGDQIILEEGGSPAAAVVPLHVLEAYERNREQLFGLMEEVAERNIDRDPEELEAMIKAEVEAARREFRLREK